MYLEEKIMIYQAVNAIKNKGLEETAVSIGKNTYGT